jgi:two-component sensor histidine kinase
MKELAHRAKNQLSVVQALARLISRRSTSINSFQARFLPRLEGLSRSIDVLTQRDWRGAGLKDLIAAHLDIFSTDAAARYKLSGPDILVKPAAVERLGLALHELATNASKYGALSLPGGVVRVDWRIDRAEDRNEFTMIWREEGGPPVTAPSQTGFGHVLIEDMIRSTLDADVTVDFRPDGLVWQMTCEVARLVDVD